MTLWNGRFNGKMDPLAWKLNASLPFDQRLAAQDITGSLAWAAALQNAGVLTLAELNQIQTGLQTIQIEFQQDGFVFAESDEDIHTAVERRLGELIGPASGKLHTGRSRNDQVATDFRLWMLEAIPALDASLAAMQTSLLQRARSDLGIIMPGYTHLQRAQPILISHWWLSHFWPLQRDRQRLAQGAERTSWMPLGCGALSGTGFPVDRAALAASLGFCEPAPNSIDAVSDRDFAAEFLFYAALVGIHLSKLAEDVVLYTSAEFGFFELSDRYATGSSLMPQKKNPDLFELARGKAGALIGQLTGLLATLKGLPSAYDKDLQEDKVPVFTAYETLQTLLPALAGALDTLKLHPDVMRSAIDASMLATDLAEALVRKGIPFREAHAIAGKAARLSVECGIPLNQVDLLERGEQGAFLLSQAELVDVFDPVLSIEKRNQIGGTALSAVQAQIAHAQALLK